MYSRWVIYSLIIALLGIVIYTGCFEAEAAVQVPAVPLAQDLVDSEEHYRQLEADQSSSIGKLKTDLASARANAL